MRVVSGSFVFHGHLIHADFMVQDTDDIDIATDLIQDLVNLAEEDEEE